MMHKENYNYIPADHSRQVTIEYYIEKILKQAVSKPMFVLDLGCGVGESMNYFSSLNSSIEWYGVDIEKSPEVLNRKSENKRFITYDGINIPFPDDHFDIIYCRQVFEHVRYPRELLKEVNRVLKPSGYFVGSTSHLEPFHSYSFWNYTPFGFNVLLEEAKLKTLELRPSIDSLTLIIRRGLGCPSFFKIFWKHESPLNFFITMLGKISGTSAYTINSIKLMFCGQFIFYVTKAKTL